MESDNKLVRSEPVEKVAVRKRCRSTKQKACKRKSKLVKVTQEVRVRPSKRLLGENQSTAAKRTTRTVTVYKRRNNVLLDPAHPWRKRILWLGTFIGFLRQKYIALITIEKHISMVIQLYNEEQGLKDAPTDELQHLTGVKSFQSQVIKLISENRGTHKSATLKYLQMFLEDKIHQMGKVEDEAHHDNNGGHLLTHLFANSASSVVKTPTTPTKNTLPAAQEVESSRVEKKMDNRSETMTQAVPLDPNSQDGRCDKKASDINYIDELEQQRKDLQKEKAELKEEVKQLKDKLRKRKGKNSELKDQIKRNKLEKMAKLQEISDVFLSQILQYKSELEENRVEIQKLQAKLARNEEKNKPPNEDASSSIIHENRRIFTQEDG